jgi:DNA-binding GntR family transcriptional regulator
MDDQSRARLERISGESQKLKKGNTTRLAALLTQFDDVLFEQVHNGRIRALIENLRAHLTRIGHLTEGIPGRIEASVDQHDRIVEAIAAHDPLAAEKHLRDHIRSVRDDQLKALAEAADHE